MAIRSVETYLGFEICCEFNYIGNKYDVEIFNEDGTLISVFSTEEKLEIERYATDYIKFYLEQQAKFQKEKTKEETFKVDDDYQNLIKWMEKRL